MKKVGGHGWSPEVIQWVYPRDILGIYLAYLDDILGKLGIFWGYLGRFYGYISAGYLVNILGISWRFLEDILGVSDNLRDTWRIS